MRSAMVLLACGGRPACMQARRARRPPLHVLLLLLPHGDLSLKHRLKFYCFAAPADKPS
eukprot:COSAG01_NODE_555_length_15533_cov_35.243310_15_plen_59_part_00